MKYITHIISKKDEQVKMDFFVQERGYRLIAIQIMG